MTSYMIDVQTSAKDRKKLATNKYNLAVAKIVKEGDNEATPNIIFQERDVKNANTNISWKEVYGFNYITDMPGKGAKVVGSGVWTKCDIGQGLDLDNTGTFIYVAGKSSTALNVVNNHGDDINVIVGIQDQASSEWLPIYMSQNKLLNGATGQFTPTPKVQLWYGNEQKESHMIAAMATKEEIYTVVANTTHYFHYDTEGGNWTDQTNPFVLDQTPPPANVIAMAHVAYAPGFSRILTFAKSVTSLSGFMSTFAAAMLARGWKITIELVTANFRFKITAARTTGLAMAEAFAAHLDQDIDASIVVTQNHGDVPKDDAHSLSTGAVAALEDKPVHKRVDSGTVERADVTV